MLKKILQVNCMFILFILFTGKVSSQVPEEVLLSGNFNKVPLTRFFKTIEAGFPVKFYYKNEWFENDVLTGEFVNKPLEEVINIVLAGKSYTYRIINENHVVFLPKDDVDMLMGQIKNYTSNAGTDASFILVGSQDMAGKLKTAMVTGKVNNGKTGEPIIGAAIQVNNLSQGAVTNVQGYYKLTLAPGLYTLVISSVGFERAQYNVKIIGNGELDIELFDKSVALDDIIIYGQRLDKNVSGHQMSMVELDKKAIGQLPSGAGGKDVLKGLTIMPGVKSIGEFSSGINVRGGGEDQNLYLINSAPLFNTSHVFGLFSVINPDAVDRLSLYKGHIPASYGERVSSVVDVRTQESPPERTVIKGGIGLYDSRLMIEVPIIKNKLFFDLGGRTSYSDWLLNRMKDYNLRNSSASFYDLNGTIHAILGKNRIALSAYSCYDEFRFSSEVRYKYGSNLGSLNWSYLINSNLASYLTLAYSEYNAQKDDISSDLLQNSIKSSINYRSLKYRIKYAGIQHHTIDAGFNLISYHIQPGIQVPLNSISLVAPKSLEPEQGYEGAVFLNDEININDYLSVNMGLRYSAYANTGPGSVAGYSPDMPRDTNNITGYLDYGKNDIIQFYRYFEPRLSAHIKLNEGSSLKVSYNRNVQYISLITYTSVATPSDIWKLADPFIKPLIANQFAIGYYHNFFNNTIETSLEVYYKGLFNVVDYKDGVQLEMNSHIESQLVTTTGRNYGLEFLFKKNSGKLDGWITYTFSRSLRKTNATFPEETINHNHYYPSAYDRPHDFNIVANYHLNRRVMFSANFTYSSGRPITLPEYKYITGNEVMVFFSDKNKYRIPDYNRLDLTISLYESLSLKKKWKGSWSFSVLNVYGRKNAFTIYYKKEDPSAANDYNRFSLYKLYLIGRPVPTITYSFIF